MTEKSVTRIRPAPEGDKKLRAAAYCRVSTGSGRQLASIENQKRHYELLVGNRPDWELVSIYYEEGISGTKMDIRPELSRMLEDCRKGRIDLILTKSISRFARNTSECLQMIREVTSHGVRLYFEKENLDTGSMDGEFVLTVLSLLAEEESRSISGNTAWGVQKRFQEGRFRYSNAPYGYRLENGTFAVEEREAEVLRRMFREVLAGSGTWTIAKRLNEDGIPARKGGIWYPQTVQKILANAACTGDVLWQKSFSDGHFGRVQNHGQRDRYYVENHHPGILDKETFALAGEAMKSRGCAGQAVSSPLSGKLRCGFCGSPLIRITQKTAGGSRIRWGCRQHLRCASSCPAERVLEEDVINSFLTMMHRLWYSMPVLLDPYLEAKRRQKETEQGEKLGQIRKALEQNMQKRHRLARKESAGPFLVLLEQEAASLYLELSRLSGRQEGNDETEELRKAVFSLCGEGTENDMEEVCRQFSSLVGRVDVCRQGKSVFHLRCGLVFTEGEKEWQ